MVENSDSLLDLHVASLIWWRNCVSRPTHRTKVLSQIFVHSYSPMGPMQPHPEFNSLGDCHGHCGRRVILALFPRDFVTLPLLDLKVKSEKMSVTLTHKDPHLTTEQSGLTHPPHTFLHQKNHPSLSNLCPFIKCLFSVLKHLFTDDRCPSHNSLRRKGDLLAQV